MFDAIQRALSEKNIRTHKNNGILIAQVNSAADGFDLAKTILKAVVDKKTALFLSGGRTPKELYASIATEELFSPGIAGLVDERYGEKMHDNSNEKMLKDTGLLRYFSLTDTPFYPVLQKDKSRGETAEAYDQKLRSLLSVYQKHIAVLGVGLDGHTAGIAGNRPDFINPLFDPSRKDLLVSEFDDPEGMFKERITMTFIGLSMMDFLLVLVFGEDKQKALDLVFAEGKEEEIPSRFLKRPDIAPKTLLITDQNV